MKSILPFIVVGCAQAGVAPARESIPTAVIQSGADFQRASWSPDGKLFATWAGFALQLWDGESGALRASIDAWVDDVRWSSDGSKLVALLYRGGVVVVNLAGGSVKRLGPSDDRMKRDFGCFAVSADGNHLAVSTFNGVPVWDLPSGRLIGRLTGARGPVSGGNMHCAAAGDFLAMGADARDGTVDVFDLRSGARARSLRYVEESADWHEKDAQAMALAPGGDAVAIGTIHGRLRVGKASGEIVASPNTFDDGEATALVWRGGRFLLAGRTRFAGWDGHGPIVPFPVEPSGPYNLDAALSDDGSRAAVGSRSALVVIDVASGKPLRKLGPGLIAPTGRTALVIADDALSLVDVGSGAVRAKIARVPEARGQFVDGRYRAGGLALELESGQVSADASPIEAPDRHGPNLAAGEVKLLATQGERALGIVGCEDGFHYCPGVYDVASKERRVALKDAASLFAYRKWAFSPDGKLLAHGADDEAGVAADGIQLFDASSGKRTRLIDTHADALAFASPRVLAIVGAAGRLRLLRLTDGATLEVLVEAGRRLAVAPDGRFEGDEALLPRVLLRGAAAVGAPLHPLTSDAARLRSPGLWAAFLDGK